MTVRFRNPQNGHTEEIVAPGMFSFLFGFFYFAVKGIWTHAVVGLVLGICTVGISWFIYPFFASGIVRAHYLRKGWIDLDGARDEDDELQSAKERIMRRGRQREQELRTRPQRDADFDAVLEKAGKRILAKQRRAQAEDDA